MEIECGGAWASGAAVVVDEAKLAEGKFQLVGSTDKDAYRFKAKSEVAARGWVKAMQRNVLKAQAAAGQPPDHPPIALAGPALSILTLQATLFGDGANRACCDCDAGNPEWSAVNLGITLCLDCALVHQKLGPDISRLRSITLQDWDAGTAGVVAAVGNTRSNRVWLAKQAGVTMLFSAAENRVREAFILAK
jgi:hypothetical protein